LRWWRVALLGNQATKKNCWKRWRRRSLCQILLRIVLLSSLLDAAAKLMRVNACLKRNVWSLSLTKDRLLKLWRNQILKNPQRQLYLLKQLASLILGDILYYMMPVSNSPTSITMKLWLMNSFWLDISTAVSRILVVFWSRVNQS